MLLVSLAIWPLSMWSRRWLGNWRRGVQFIRYKQDVCCLAKFGDFDISMTFFQSLSSYSGCVGLFKLK